MTNAIPEYLTKAQTHADTLNNHTAYANIGKIIINNAKNPFFQAVENGDVFIVHLLITYGADVNQINEDGFTPLCTAAVNGDIRMAIKLLANNADPTQTCNGKTPQEISFIIGDFDTKSVLDTAAKLAGTVNTDDVVDHEAL